MAHDLASQHLTDFDNVTEWLSEWFQSKDSLFYRRGVHLLPDKWKNCVASEGM